ncbi:MAG TPA: iron-sulfur cluster repair di-iron protein, ric [Clostridiales bacterium]|jgi:regulator of cell morphogenesis and NO signaling|nr:iron-sulfur cluster repair di-iron protein, ric [Clostridiales bacterium]
MKNYKETYAEFKEKLELYVPVVAKVHGDSHPEFLEVKALYDSMKAALDGGAGDLDADFEKLRQITSDYAVPSDTCETYEAVYQMLEAIDRAYSAQ